MPSLHRAPWPVEANPDPIRKLLDAFDAEFQPRTPCPSDGSPEWDAFLDQRAAFLAEVDDDSFGLGPVDVLGMFLADNL